MSLRATVSLAPADRAPGRRGLRGRLAALVVLGAVVGMDVSRLVGTTSGSGGPDAWNLQYTVHNPTWSTSRLLLAAALLLGAGMALWLARARVAVLLASIVAIGGGALAGVTIANPQKHLRLSPASFQGVQLGVTKSQLVARFGSPASTDASATPMGGGPSFGCLVYRAASGDPQTVDLFCFDHGRLRVKESL